ncbi:type II toxin-antitoxin system RelE family toxin [Prescottella subtropica]|uniref:type II toxin-antitoxin system RelE family toxin n=1 Tax=Prescottella subtropica TaxID=2545757 RepID=UPI0010F9F5CF|nr:type II toxin-antitoxin system RelE/ParE family toxin [Prescottella subtropica]
MATNRYSVTFAGSAKRDLKKIAKHDRKLAEDLLDVAEALGDNPRPHGCTKLTDREGYRVRFGDFRILYSILDTEVEVHVFRVGDRKEVY